MDLVDARRQHPQHERSPIRAWSPAQIPSLPLAWNWQPKLVGAHAMSWTVSRYEPRSVCVLLLVATKTCHRLERRAAAFAQCGHARDIVFVGARLKPLLPRWQIVLRQIALVFLTLSLSMCGLWK
jgi:hypothetical protein